MGTPFSLKNHKVGELQMDWLMVRRPERGEGGNHPAVHHNTPEGNLLDQN
jgi:hypothetical protein